uniref:Uncharacterized protein n=1 Tax=Globodera rostochiensis TaxID=31243 RepID=A0A914HAL8_GLORO
MNGVGRPTLHFQLPPHPSSLQIRAKNTADDAPSIRRQYIHSCVVLVGLEVWRVGRLRRGVGGCGDRKQRRTEMRIGRRDGSRAAGSRPSPIPLRLSLAAPFSPHLPPAV